MNSLLTLGLVLISSFFSIHANAQGARIFGTSNLPINESRPSTPILTGFEFSPARTITAGNVSTFILPRFKEITTGEYFYIDASVLESKSDNPDFLKRDEKSFCGFLGFNNYVSGEIRYWFDRKEDASTRGRQYMLEVKQIAYSDVWNHVTLIPKVAAQGENFIFKLDDGRSGFDGHIISLTCSK